MTTSKGRITEELLKKRSEHNDGVLSDLKEIALHQFEIERIELLGERCRHLQILLLQHNLISRIENLHKLRELKYLNLALNNITRIEGLENCESLEKLDLTCNFIEDLASAESLRTNVHLRELFLVGNPCARIPCYREFVIAALPQLEELDGERITRTERITAAQNWEQNRRTVLESSTAAKVQQEKQEFSPEARTAMYRELSQKKAEMDEAKGVTEKKPKPKEPTPIALKEDGQVMQRNEGDWPFVLRDEGKFVSLDVAFPKFMDTSLINVEPQPKYIRIVAKGKVFQVNFPDEVKPDSGTAERSITTGHLLLKFPKVRPSECPADQPPPPIPVSKAKKSTPSTSSEAAPPATSGAVDVRTIVDNPDVPPLE